jgi:hypothetical protein
MPWMFVGPVPYLGHGTAVEGIAELEKCPVDEIQPHRYAYTLSEFFLWEDFEV